MAKNRSEEIYAQDDDQQEKTDEQTPDPNGETSANAAATETADADEPSVDEEIDRLRDEAARNLDNYQRAVAELANYRRRKEQETERLIDQSREVLLRKILPVVDDFERALKTIDADQESAEWIEGIRLIERKLSAVLESEGVRPMESVGQSFDPNLHEAVQVDDRADGRDTVIEEYQRGYYINERVLRPALVKVGSQEALPSADD